MRQPKIVLHSKPVNRHGKGYIELYGWYDGDKIIHINLYHILNKHKEISEQEIIRTISDTVEHEVLHYILAIIYWQSDITLSHIQDFYEEKLIRDILGDKFNPEDYCDLIIFSEEEEPNE